MPVVLQPRPAPAAPAPRPFPAFERTRLGNGIEVLASHLQDRPLIEVRIVLKGGALIEPTAVPGLAALATASVAEGTEARDAEQMALDVESRAARLDFMPTWNALVGSLSVPARNLGEALDLAFEATTSPAFRGEDVERVRRRFIGMLASAYRMPKARVGLGLLTDLFEASSRMAWPIEGTLEGLAAATPDAVQAYWDSAVRPDTCTIVVVGDLRGIDFTEMLAGTFGTWAVGGPPAPTSGWAPETFAVEPGIKIIHVPGAVQTTLSLGAAGPRVSPEQRGALRVAVHYLGGFFGGRLNIALREQRNIAYGASAGLEHRSSVAMLTAGSDVQTDATGEAVSAVLEEIAAVAAGHIDGSGLREAVDNIVRTTSVTRKRAGAIAGALTELVIHGLSDDYHDRVAADIAATGPTEAAAALRRHIAVDRLRIVAAGDAAHIEEPLRALGWGEVVVEPLV